MNPPDKDKSEGTPNSIAETARRITVAQQAFIRSYESVNNAARDFIVNAWAKGVEQGLQDSEVPLELENETQDAPSSSKHGAPRLKDREPEDYQIEIALKYQEELTQGKSHREAAELAGAKDYRTVEGWMKAWPKLLEKNMDQKSQTSRK